LPCCYENAFQFLGFHAGRPDPHVSGVAALIVGKYGHMPASQLATMIQQSAADILKPEADAETGKGRIDAWKAVH